MKAIVFLPILAALALGGCVSMSRSSPVAELPDDWAAQGKVSEIVLRAGDIKVSPQFEQTFKGRVQTKLDQCAKGQRPLRLEASVTRLDKANVVMTAVIGGANVLRGEAKLVDVATGQTVGAYNVGETVVGGRVAVFVMAEAEEQLSDAFGQELCEQAFPPAAD